jgi:hypothetical protein
MHLPEMRRCGRALLVMGIFFDERDRSRYFFDGDTLLSIQV